MCCLNGNAIQSPDSSIQLVTGSFVTVRLPKIVTSKHVTDLPHRRCAIERMSSAAQLGHVHRIINLGGDGDVGVLAW